jgi:hypothetical protein
MRNILSSQAVKEVYQKLAVPNRLTTSVFISDYSTLDLPLDKVDKFIESKKDEMLYHTAEHVRKHMPLTAVRRDDPRNHERGTEVRGECFVFTLDELLKLMDALERKAVDSVTPHTIWGD